MTVEEWEEIATSIMYYGEPNMNEELFQQTTDAFGRILSNAKINTRTRLITLLLENMIEHKVDHPLLIEQIEKHLVLRQ